MDSQSPSILTPLEVRVLGSLVEKAVTTPDYYPLTLNALTNACNQSNNRDPVVEFGEQEVLRGLDSLREKKLAFLFEGADSRVAKFGHRLVEALELAPPELAVMCVLLLRGPQTIGEVRGRTGRMHAFESLAETEGVLDALGARAFPLVVKLARESGRKEQRYAHLLSGTPTAPNPGAEPATQGIAPANERISALEAEAAALRAEVAELRREFAEFRKQLG